MTKINKHLIQESKVEKEILFLANQLGFNESANIRDIFEIYSKILIDHKNISFIRDKLKIHHPKLFDRRIIHPNKKTISYFHQEKLKEKILQTHEEKIKSFLSSEHVSKYIQNSDEIVTKIKEEIFLHFPQEHAVINHRVKKPESILQNIQWGNRYTLTDLIGFRIVPKKTKMLPDMIEKFENNWSDRLAFKFNIFSYDLDEIIKRISKNSIYYRAFHYHFPIENYFSEVQIRTRGVDIWANINHDTMYKKKININLDQEKHIMEFGKIANIVDYWEILQN